MPLQGRSLFRNDIFISGRIKNPHRSGHIRSHIFQPQVILENLYDIESVPNGLSIYRDLYGSPLCTGILEWTEIE